MVKKNQFLYTSIWLSNQVVVSVIVHDMETEMIRNKELWLMSVGGSLHYGKYPLPWSHKSSPRYEWMSNKKKKTGKYLLNSFHESTHPPKL